MDREELLDAIGRCYMRAAVDQLLASENFGAPDWPGSQPRVGNTNDGRIDERANSISAGAATAS